MGKIIGERGKQANLEPSAIIANERKGQSLYIKMYLFFFFLIASLCGVSEYAFSFFGVLITQTE